MAKTKKKSDIKNNKSKSDKTKSNGPKSREHFKKNKYLYITLGLVIVIIIAILLNLKSLSNITFPVFSSGAVASINGESISQAELDERYNFLFFIMGYPEEYKSIITKDIVLDNLVNEKLLLQEAAKQGVSVTDTEIDDGISELLQKSETTQSELESSLVENGFSMNYLRSYYRNQMIISKLLDNEVLSKITVTDAEIEKYYNSNSEDYIAGQGEIRARHILVTMENEINEIDAIIKKTPLTRLKETFIELAKERSTDKVTAVDGGDLGFFARGDMVQEFGDAAFKLKVGGVSDPVKTQFGWHIIMRDNNQIYLSEAYDSIKQILTSNKEEESLRVYLDKLKNNANIVTGNAVSNTELTTSSSCMQKYDLEADAVIFYHSQSCPHCQNMIPIVRELEKEGYSFYWADAADESSDVVSECYQDVLQGGVPEFICAGSKDYQLGEMSKDKLKSFADRCKE